MTSPQRECFGPCDHPDGPGHAGKCRTGVSEVDVAVIRHLTGRRSVEEVRRDG